MGQRPCASANVGIPTVGFTWYSLTDQVDWDTALREQNGNVNPLGLFDLDRNIRAVGRAYKKLISDWREVLPASSLCLIVPIVPPSQWDAGLARQQRESADRHPRGVVAEAANPERAAETRTALQIQAALRISCGLSARLQIANLVLKPGHWRRRVSR